MPRPSTTADAVELVVPALVSQGFELLTVNGLTRDRNGMQQGARLYGFR